MLKTVVLAAFFLTSAAVGHGAVPRAAVPDERIAAQGKLVAAGSRVEIYEYGVTVDRAFLKLMEEACEQVEKVTGLPLDTATLGPVVRVYISDAVAISHVWKGYQHPSDPKAILFLNPRVYRDALNRTNATYIHELTHLFAWRFGSHTLREGFADYVALKILPGAAVGPNPAGEAAGEIPPEVIEHLGTAKPAPQWVSTDPTRRSAYYLASYRLVKFLIGTKDMGTFLKLYRSEKPESDIEALYGLSREQAIRAALADR